MLADQHYDQFAARRIRQLEETPQRFVRDVFSNDFIGCRRDLVAGLGDLRGKRVLELGSGFGDLALWLHHRGAKVSAIELGPQLIKAAQKLAALNSAPIDFHQGDIAQRFPFEDESFDVVIGLLVVHHLEPEPLKAMLRECHRVLEPGGSVWIFEPMENSQAFNFVQNLMPIPFGPEPRPSILQRAKWREYLKTIDDRPLTNKELLAAGPQFASTTLRNYGLTIRFRAIVGPGWDGFFDAIDETLLKVLPFLKRFGQTALVRYLK